MSESIDHIPAGSEDKLWDGGMEQQMVLISVKHKDKPPLMCTINNWPEYVREGGRIFISTVDAPEPMVNVRAIRLKEYTGQTKFNLTSVAKVVCRDKKLVPLYKALDQVRTEHGIQTKRMKPMLPEGGPTFMFQNSILNRGLPHGGMLNIPGLSMYNPGSGGNGAQGLAGVTGHISTPGLPQARADDVLNQFIRQAADKKPHAMQREEVHELHRTRSTGPSPVHAARDEFDLLGGDALGGTAAGSASIEEATVTSDSLMEQPIEWIGNPMAPEELGLTPDLAAVDRLYYRGFVRGDAVLRLGDFVQIDIAGTHRRPQVAVIVLLWSEPGDDGASQNFARCRLFCWPKDTVYADIHWPPGELFSCDDCQDTLPLHCLLCKTTVSFRPCTGNADLMPMPGRPFPKTGFVCRFEYNSQSQTLRPAPQPPAVQAPVT